MKPPRVAAEAAARTRENVNELFEVDRVPVSPAVLQRLRSTRASQAGQADDGRSAGEQRDQFSSDYHRMFGEKPSETLRRGA